MCGEFKFWRDFAEKLAQQAHRSARPGLQSADYAAAVAPNALYLNDFAKDLLSLAGSALINSQQKYDMLNEMAQAREKAALNGLVQSAKRRDGHDESRPAQLSREQFGRGKLAPRTIRHAKFRGHRRRKCESQSIRYAERKRRQRRKYRLHYGESRHGQRGGQRAQSIADEGDSATSSVNKNLRGYIPQNNDATNLVNGLLGNYMNSDTTATDNANADLTEYINRNKSAYSTVDRSLTGLENGVLPQGYQDAMSNAIASALQRTTGNAMNNLAQRGVLNSSVTSTALNDITRNAADVTAQNYLNNINTLQNLAQQRYNNSLNTNQINAGLEQQAYGNTMSNLGTRANLTQTALGNTNQNLQNAALGSQTNIAQQQLTNTLCAIAGTGTTTSTQTSSGGGFLSGLFGGIF